MVRSQYGGAFTAVPISKAINHMLGIWKELNVYLQDGRIPIDNNLCENALRSIAIGRKNWLLSAAKKAGVLPPY